MEDERVLKKITLEYEDGEIQEVSKGFIVGFQYCKNSNTGEDEVNMTYNLVNISGSELKNVVSSVLMLADNLGRFE